MSIVRRRRCLPIESDSSEDDRSNKRRLRSSSTSSTQAVPFTNNRRKGGRVPIVSDESEESSDEEVLEYIGIDDRLNNYNRVISGSRPHGLIFGVINTRSGNRILKRMNYSSLDSSDSDSDDSIRFQRKKKRMKLCSSSSSESSSENEPIGGHRRTVRLDDSVRQDNQDRPDTSMNSGRNRVSSNKRKWSRIESSDSESEATSDDDIRPIILRHESRTVFYSSSSSSDSEDEMPKIRRIKRKVARTILYSDEDNGLQQKVSDDNAEICPICLSDFDLQEVGKPSTCEHSFCFSCIEEWAKNNNTCPVDRQPFASILVLSSINGTSVQEIPVFNIQRMLTGWEAEQVEISDSDLEVIRFQNYSSDDDQDGISEVCCYCLTSSADDSLIYCDACYDVYHLECVNPPLYSYPAGPWICTRCDNMDG